MKGRLLHHLLHLHHHDAAVVVNGFGDDEGVEVHDLVLKGRIALAVAGRGADEGDIGRNRLVVEVFLVVDVDELDQVFLRHVVQFAALVARIDEGAEADFRDDAGLVGSRRAEHLREDALRVVPGRDLVLLSELGNAGRLSPVAAERPLDEAFLGNRADAALGAVAETRRADDAEVLRGLGGLVAFGERFDELRRFKNAAAGAENAERGFVRNVGHGLFGGHDGHAAVDALGFCNLHGILRIERPAPGEPCGRFARKFGVSDSSTPFSGAR